ncbi:MAG: translation initiation factor IF-2, partial [Myxococcota bacterium]
MAKIRAYKLAEELGIERSEFVEKALSAGIELKSAMAALEPEVADQLREKFGSTPVKKVVFEKRVERKGSATVIRRRKKKEEPPPPPPVEEVVPTSSEFPVAPEPVGAAEAESGELVQSELEVATESSPERAVESQLVADPMTEERITAPAARSSQPPGSAAATPGADDRKGRHRKRVREVVNLREQEQFARQVTGRAAPRRTTVVDSRYLVSPRRRRRDAPAAPRPAKAAPKEASRLIRVEGEISVGELARQLGMKAAQVQAKLMALGTMVSVNQSVDVDTTRKIAGEMGFEVQDIGFKEEELLDLPAGDAASGSDGLRPRPPVVTVMGNVDHGKTSLLDAIRDADVVSSEAGGITQHIGAYRVQVGDSTLTFIDTPGHAAFTAMRARGVQVTDLVVLVVAATDGVMPQTIEAIDHCKAAATPIVVAVNKCDLPQADPQKTRQRLMENGIVSEEFGGDIICIDVSATKRTGLDKLLEMLSLQSEMLELVANPERRARGVVLEARLDRGRGPVATVLVQDGTLRGGDVVVVGTHWGRVRMMENDRGERIKEAGPSMPVQVIGLAGVPDAGAAIHVVENERAAKRIVSHREAQLRGKPADVKPRVTLEEFFARSEGGGVKELPLVLKADVHGTCEAVRDSLEKLSTDAVKLNVLSAGVGAISENDVTLASASRAIVVGFNVRPDPAARRAADTQGVDVRTYQVIMNLLDEVRAAMAGLLPPTVKEKPLGRVEVRELFMVPKLGAIAGSYVSEGVVRRNAQCRLVRDGVQVYDGRIGSLRRFKDDVREVQNGFECGVGIE